jgi:hypothetical protein
MVAHWQEGPGAQAGAAAGAEQERLRAGELPEMDEVLGLLAGQVPSAPALTVAFSGLGQRAASWIRGWACSRPHLRAGRREQAALVRW